MLARGQGNVNSVDGVVLEKFVVCRMEHRNFFRAGERLRSISVAGRDGCHFNTIN
jgi:hypothetical protein